jgi:hypothetical protein
MHSKSLCVSLHTYEHTIISKIRIKSFKYTYTHALFINLYNKNILQTHSTHILCCHFLKINKKLDFETRRFQMKSKSLSSPTTIFPKVVTINVYCYVLLEKNYTTETASFHLHTRIPLYISI